jgi:hypothetical protein
VAEYRKRRDEAATEVSLDHVLDALT